MPARIWHTIFMPARVAHRDMAPNCAWIASLLRYGLLEASCVPELEVRQLRDLCRMRATLVRKAVQVGNRLRKVLEDANIKLDSVASDALGGYGAGDDPGVDRGARGRLRAKLPEVAGRGSGALRERDRAAHAPF
jgi:hypothetical protein